MEIVEENEAKHPQKLGQLSQFYVIRELGEGYTSKIMLGYDPEVKKHVALKILKSSISLGDKALQSEVGVLSKLNHKNIIQIYEV